MRRQDAWAALPKDVHTEPRKKRLTVAIVPKNRLVRKSASNCEVDMFQGRAFNQSALGSLCFSHFLTSMISFRVGYQASAFTSCDTQSRALDFDNVRTT